MIFGLVAGEAMRAYHWNPRNSFLFIVGVFDLDLKDGLATYWDILRLGSCQTYQLLYGHVLQSTFTSLCNYLVRFPPKVVFLRQTRYCTCDFTWELKWCVPRLFRCYFFTEVYAVIVSGFSSACSLIKTSWKGYPYLPAHFWVFDIWLSATLWSDSYVFHC